MIWLGIDTANSPLSVAVVKDGEVLVEDNSSMAIHHSLRAMPAIEELFQKAGLTPSDIDAIAVSEGPGSYTGVRIGVTIAKTLAWTLGIPLIGVSSLLTLAANGSFFNGLVCPIFDARRNNVYAAVYQFKGSQYHSVLEDGHFSIEGLLERLKDTQQPILFIGIDAKEFKEDILNALGEQAVFASAPLNLPRASALITIAKSSEQASEIHTFTPEYRRIAEAEANWLQAQGKEKEL